MGTRGSSELGDTPQRCSEWTRAPLTREKSELPAHRPPRDQQRRRELLKQRYGELGEEAVKFLDGLLQSQRNGWQQAEKVLALLASYRPADFQAALARAIRYGAFSLSAVQRILAVPAQPKSCLEQLADQASEQLPDTLRTPATPPRPPTAYQPLLFPETTAMTNNRKTPRQAKTKPQQTPPPPAAATRTRKPTTADLRDQILADFAALRVPLSAEEFDEVLRTAEQQSLSHLEFLQRLVGTQAEQRRQRAIERRIREACFREVKLLEDFD